MQRYEERRGPHDSAYRHRMLDHPAVRFYRNRLTRGSYVNRDDPDPLNHYRVVWVEGHGLRAEYKTTDLLTVAEIVAKQEELEDELRRAT